jgi:macrodomain Ter protein organizer (MatP/YcbG family)
MTRNKHKAWTQLSLDELREATKEFDKPIPFSATRALTPAERARFEQGRRASASKNGAGKSQARKQREIKVKLDQELLRRSTDYAAKHKMTLSDVISRSLVSALAFAE